MDLKMLHSVEVQFFQDDHKINAPDVIFITIQRNLNSTMVGLRIAAFNNNNSPDDYFDEGTELYLYGNLELYGESDGFAFKMILNEGQEWLLTSTLITCISVNIERKIQWEGRTAMTYQNHVLRINQSFFADLMRKITEHLEFCKIGNIIFQRKELSELSTHFQVSNQTCFEDEQKYGDETYGPYDNYVDNELPCLPPDLHIVSSDITAASN